MNSAKKSYVLAEKLWADGNYAVAVAEFEKVIAKDPRGKLGQQALFRSATTQAFFLSQYAEAIRKLQTYSELNGNDPRGWDAQKIIGDLLYSKMEQYDQAIQHYSALLKQKSDTPERAEFLFRIGKSHFFLTQFDEALRVYRDLLKKVPTGPWAEKAAYEIGITHFTRGAQHTSGNGPGMEAYQEAIDAFSWFLKKFPTSELRAQAKFGIASCLEELDQLSAAYHAYEELKSSYPSPKVIAIKLERIRERKAQRSR